MLKKILKLFGVLLFLLLVLVVVLPFVIDPNDYKAEISQATKSATGRDLRLNGDISWSVFPSLALKFEDVEMGNANGFSGNMFTVEEMSAKVKLLPLISRDIQVGQVTLRQPKINLQSKANGVNSWDDLFTTTPDSGTDSGSTALNIRGIRIEQAELSYHDAAAGSQILLKGFDFETDEIAPGVISHVKATGQLQMPDSGLDVRLDAEASVQGLFSESGMSITFDQLQLNGLLSSEAVLPLGLNADNGTVDLAKGTMSFDPIEVKLGQEFITLRLQGQDLMGRMKLSGEMSTNDMDLDRLLADMGTPLNNEADNIINAQAAWEFSENRLNLSGLKLDVDGQVLKGQAQFSDLAKMQGRFDLSADRFHVDPYLPQDETVSASSSSASESGALNFGRLQGQFKMTELLAFGMQLNDIVLKVNTNGPQVDVVPLNAKFYQGLITTRLNLDASRSTEKLRISHDMNDIQAGGMVQDLMGSEYVTGDAQLDANIVVNEPFSEQPMKSAHGTINVSVKDGDIKGFDVFDIIQKSLSLTGQDEARLQDENLKTEYGELRFQANVNQGILRSTELLLSSPYFRVTGAVTIDLDQMTIDGQIKPVLTNIPEGVLGAEYEKLLNVKIPVEMKGDLLAPEIKIDLKSLILDSQKDKLIDKLLGGDKKQKSDLPMTEKERKREEKDAMKRALLKGLLGGKKKEEEDEQPEDQEGGN